MNINETIVAISTPPGRGGVGIVRLSGDLALNIAEKLSDKKLKQRCFSFCSFKDNKDELIDTGLALYFKAPHSFTGEDVVELQVHGSPIVLDILVKACLVSGARLARPGEFSERAFLNDKIDLTQAEAIADLIQSSSESAARMATKSLQGEFSKQISELNEELIHLRIFVESAIDFPEEEIDFLNDGKILSLLESILLRLQELRKTAKQGSLMREGLSLVITGKPNAGKSTLINSLAGKDVAIVTEIPGTTRDVMREQILLDDLPLHIVDTAGLRESSDLIEQEGIKRAWDEVARADCILHVMDITDAIDHESLSELIMTKAKGSVPLISIYNKIDKLNAEPCIDKNSVHLSLKTGQGLDLLKAKIKEVVGFQPTEGLFLARRRHIQALDEALKFLVLGKEQLLTNRAGELLADDLRRAHQVLGEITGEFSSDDLLGKIFSSFCIGK